MFSGVDAYFELKTGRKISSCVLNENTGWLRVSKCKSPVFACSSNRKVQPDVRKKFTVHS